MNCGDESLQRFVSRLKQNVEPASLHVVGCDAGAPQTYEASL
jgi:hypothetical protein